MHILVIEDEVLMAEALAARLKSEDRECTIATTGEAGLQLLRAGSFDLMVLDVMLPRQSGLDVLRTLRRDGFTLPTLLLTSRNSIEDRVLGLDAGADDYMVKPFAFPELEARIRALLRRGAPHASSYLHLADLAIDVAGRTATRGGHTLDLTEREFDLLEYLLRNRGTVVSRRTLAREIWKETTRHTSLDNVIDVQIGRLRRKLGEPHNRRLLHTVRGVGYVLREPVE